LKKHLLFVIERNNVIEEFLVILSLSKDRQDCIFLISTIADIGGNLRFLYI